VAEHLAKPSARCRLAGLRETSGEIAAAVAALEAARGCFEKIGERRGLVAAADLGRRLGARAQR
jgi:hypothetical protein